MKKLLLICLAVAALLATGCKTTEENYRAAYEKAISARQKDDIDTTEFKGFRRELKQSGVVTASGDTIAVRTLIVSLVDANNAPAPLKRYSIVVGQFKLLFNATSMSERLQDAGFSTAEVVKTGEPYYYVIISTHSSVTDANAAMQALSKQKLPIALNDPLPFILENPRLK